MDVRDRSLDVAPINVGAGKFGIGQPVPRSEGARLLRGEGCYTHDVQLPAQSYPVMVRSRHAHGIIKGIATDAARAMPGVLGIYTGSDLEAAGFGTLKCMMPAN